MMLNVLQASSAACRNFEEVDFIFDLPFRDNSTYEGDFPRIS